MSNIPTVQRLYEAFGQGDIPAILALLAPDVEWEYGTLDAGVPWLKTRNGVAEVPKFFEALGALDFQKFQPKTLLENGNSVVTILDLQVVVKSNGRTIVEEDEVHIFHFNEQGLITRFCHRLDTHKQWLALQTE